MRIQIGSWPADSYYFEGIWNVNGGTLYMTDLKAYTAQGYAQWENGEWDLKNGEWKPYSLNNPNKKYNNYNLGVEDGRKYLLLEPDDGKMYRE